MLLLNAMNESGMAALGRFVQQGREKLCLIRPKGDALALETLFLVADVYSQAEIEEAVEETTVKEPELALAQQVIESLAGEFDPSSLQSDYRRDLKALLEAKLAGEEIAVAPEPAEAGADRRSDGGAPPQRRGGEVGQAGRERRRQEEGGAEEGIRAAEEDRDALIPCARSKSAEADSDRAKTPKGPLARPGAALRQCGWGIAPSASSCAAKSVLSILPW